MRYGNVIIKELNNKSSVNGIFVSPDEVIVELVGIKDRSHFIAEGMVAKMRKTYTGKDKKLPFIYDV